MTGSSPWALGVGGAMIGGELQFRPMTLKCDAAGDVLVHPGSSADSSLYPPTASLIALPALTDAHVHVWNGGILPSFVPFGVTRVRDMGSPPNVRRAVREVARRRSCPWVDFGGPMIDAPGEPRMQSIMPWYADGEGPISAVRKLAEQTPSWIKIYHGLAPDLISPVVEAIHDTGAFAAIHPAPGGVCRAEQAAVDSIEHVALLAWDLTDTKATQSGSGLAMIKEVSHLWWDWGRSCSTVLAPVSTRTPVTTTLSAIYGLIAWLRGWRPSTISRELEAQWASSFLLRNWTEKDVAAAEEGVQAMASWCCQHHSSGGRLAIGTDSANPVVPPGQSVWWEIELLRQGGMHPLEAYRMASTGNIIPTPPNDWIFVEPSRAEQAAAGGSWGCSPVSAVLMRGRLLLIRTPNATSPSPEI